MRSRYLTDSEVIDIFNKNNTRIQELINFLILSDTHKYNEEYQKKYVLSTISQQEKAVEKIRALFVASLNTGPSNNLNRANISINKLLDILKPFQNHPRIYLDKFFEKCDEIIKENPRTEKIESFKDLFTYSTVKGEFPGLGKKKCALFIKNIDIAHKHENYKIFENYNVENKDLFIAIDIVITYVLNRLLKLNYLPKRDGKDVKFVIDQYRHFDIINKIFKGEVDNIQFDYGEKNNFMIIEDLWFWGYYNQTTEDRKRTMKPDNFNRAKFISDSQNFPKEETKIKELSSKFIQIVND